LAHIISMGARFLLEGDPSRQRISFRLCSRNAVSTPAHEPVRIKFPAYTSKTRNSMKSMKRIRQIYENPSPASYTGKQVLMCHSLNLTFHTMVKLRQIIQNHYFLLFGQKKIVEKKSPPRFWTAGESAQRPKIPEGLQIGRICELEFLRPLRRYESVPCQKKGPLKTKMQNAANHLTQCFTPLNSIIYL